MKTFLTLSVIITLMISQFADAQVIYTDIPDVTISTNGAVYPLDLNNDGAVDFNFSISTHTHKTKNCGTATLKSLSVSNAGKNQVLCSYNATTNSYNPKVLSRNFPVSSDSVTWTGGSLVMLDYYNVRCVEYCYYGCWYDWVYSAEGQWGYITDKYMGLKIHVGNSDYNGWVRLSTNNGITIKEYACNNTPAQIISAGQSTTEYVVIAPIPITPFCAGGNIAVPYTAYGNFSASNIFSAELSNATGSFANPVSIGTLTGTTSGTINAVIPANTPSGTGYRIRINASNPAIISDVNLSNIAISTLLPTGTVAATGTTTLCDGNVYLSTSSGSGFTYQWKRNGTNIAGATSYSYYATEAGDYSCQKTTVCGSMTTNVVTVTSVPASPVITANGSTTVCHGYGVPLTAGTYRPGNTYQWKLNGNDIVNATSFYRYADSSGNYSCVRTNSCGSATSNTITVTINPLPAVIITASPGEAACAAPVTLASNAGSGLTFEWYSSYAVIPGATLSSYSANTSGEYFLKATNTYGCSSNSNSLYITIGLLPATIYSSVNSICHGADVTFWANPVGSNLYSYEWQKNGTIISGAVTNTYTTSHPGSYSVKVTLNPGGCSSIAAPAIITQGCREANMNVTNESGDYRIFPNPLSNSTTISFSLSQSQKVSLKVYDLNGRLMEVLADREMTDGQHEVTWNSTDINAGVYLLQFQSTEFSKMEKLIVTK